MSIIQSIFLGILQGITEFLPVSSSGHLELVQALFGLDDLPLLFDVFLHLATLLAVILFFRKKIWYLILVLARWICRQPAPAGQESAEKNSRSVIIAIILGTLVTGCLGIASDKIISSLPLKTKELFICAGFLLTAVLLITSGFVSRRKGKAAIDTDDVSVLSWAGAPLQMNYVSPVQGLFIGLIQGIGTLPGISRSGSTISGALFCGVDRATAGEFSFIISIPAILGAFILEAKDLGSVQSSIGPATVIAGCIAAFITGYAALAWLMKLIRRGRLEWFAAYLIPVGIAGLVFFR